MKLTIVEKRIEELQPYEHNPRKNDAAIEAVAASIQEFGFKVPIVIDSAGVIVAGHTRLKAAKLLGLSYVPCIIADDLTEEQIKAFRLADNKTAELADWDEELLKDELAALSEIDMTLFGFEIEEADPEEITEDEFEEEPPEAARSKRGEIYQLGRHRLMIGDSTNKADVALLMNGEQAALCVTDPPYNVDYDEKERHLMAVRVNNRITEGKLTGIQNDKMKDADFLDFLTQAFENMKEALRDGGAFYIWHSAAEATNFLKACEAAGLQVRQQLIWAKNMFVIGRSDYHYKHEPCLYGWKEGAAHYFVDDRTQDTLVLDEEPDFSKMKRDEAIALLRKVWDQINTSVIRENNTGKRDLHPTMKPVNLFGKLIKNSSRQGETVLDLFGGSGTAIIAAEQLNRSAYVMEFEPKYADVIIKRFEEFTGQIARKIREAPEEEKSN